LQRTNKQPVETTNFRTVSKHKSGVALERHHFVHNHLEKPSKDNQYNSSTAYTGSTGQSNSSSVNQHYLLMVLRSIHG